MTIPFAVVALPSTLIRVGVLVVLLTRVASITGVVVVVVSNINSKFYFCMSIDIPLISILMSIYMGILLKITHNLNASK